jgi:catalase
MSESAASSDVVTQLVETMRALAGPHPGFRPVHAKGIVCSGTFRASAGARAVSRAPHLQGQAVPTILRFSNSNGDPNIHDGIPSARAIAVKFELPDGKKADILGLHIEGFLVRTPAEFLAFLSVQLPDPATGKPAPDGVPRFLQSHPATGAFIERLTKKPIPASYGQACYYSEHAFKFTAADGSGRFGRYRWVPEAGEAYLSPDNAGKRSSNFLREELEGRLKKGPASFRLVLQLAGENDPTDDATALWPADRPLVELGRLEVTQISPTSANDERRLVFDPTNITDGIELSKDPILLARSAAYSVSYNHRSKNE